MHDLNLNHAQATCAERSRSNAWTLLFLLLFLLGLVGCAEVQIKPEQPVIKLLSPNRHSYPPEQPFLRLKSKMHTAPITRIDTDAAGRFAVSSSQDKTVRVWSLKTNQLLKVLRPPIGENEEGKLYAVAMSPDGEWIATGGWSIIGNNDIYLFHRRSGRLRQRLGRLPNVIHHLAFSADGRYLAVALGEGNGIRVYKRKTKNLADFKNLTNLEHNNYGSNSYWVEFSPDGRLLSSCYDGYLRLYDRNFHLQYKVKVQGGTKPYAARFNRDGRRIVVGFSDSTHVTELDGHNLDFLSYIDTPKNIDNDLSNIAWSTDGQVLWAGGSYYEDGSSVLLNWSYKGRRTWVAASDRLTSLHALPAGGVLFSASDPLLGWFDAYGKKSLLGSSPVADFRSIFIGDFLLSNEGETVQFGYEYGGKFPMRFNLTSMNLETPKNNISDKNFTLPRTKSLNITEWKNNYYPKFNAQPLPLENFETSQSLAIAPDNNSFLLGTNWLLRYFDAQGQQIWQRPVPDVAWGVNISGNGSKAIAAFGDGTIRWYRLQDGKELLAFYPHPDRQRWIVWTPEGFFAHSPGAESLIGYHLNQGANKEALFIGVDQVYDLFYRPDLVLAKFHGDEHAIQTALTNIGDIRTVLKGGLPPSITLPDGEHINLTHHEHVLKVNLTDQGGGIGHVVVKVNGKLLPDSAVRASFAGKPIPKQQSLRIPITITEPITYIDVFAYNKKREIISRFITQKIHIPQAALDQTKKPDLYVLAVGINAYRDASIQLKYAAPDAAAVLSHLGRQQQLFGRIYSKLLTDEQAKRTDIEAALNTFAQQVKERDVFVLYLSGHGLAEDGRYHFIPQDLIYRNQTSLQHSLTQDFLKTKLKEIPARKTVMILDTCYAGQSVQTRGLETKTAFDRLMRATGTVILAAAGNTQMALEGYQGHGVFTYALLQGLRGDSRFRQ